MTTSLRTRFVAAAGIALALGAAYLTNPAVGVGQVTVHPAPNGSGPWGIAAGQHGSMWAT